MKALINSAVSVVGTTFFLMLATSLLLGQMGEAAGEKGRELEKTEMAQNLEEYSREKDMKFYGTIDGLMAKECGTADEVDEKREKICEAIRLTKQLNNLHRNHTQQMATKLKELREIKIHQLRTNIRASVLADLVVLERYYYPFLHRGMGAAIQEEVNAISDDDPSRVYLNAAFKETFIELIVVLKKEKTYLNNKKRVIVYKLVCLGQKMAWVFIKNDEETMEWTYQQFAVNLAIHSLLVNHIKSADGKGEKDEIQRMAELWPIGMTTKEEKEEGETAGHVGEFIGSQAPNLANLNEIPKDFYGVIVALMMKKCASRQFYVHPIVEKVGLCVRVKKVTELFIGLNGGQRNANKTNGEEITPIDLGAFTLMIRKMAFHDLFKLQADQNLSYDEKLEIQEEIVKIGKQRIIEDETGRRANYHRSIRVNLTKAFREAFGQIIEEKSVKNVGEEGTIGRQIQMVAYKLLCIGDFMREQFWQEREKLPWALQQISSNLAIHALRLDLPSQVEIQQIAAGWPLHMFGDEAIVEPSQ